MSLVELGWRRFNFFDKSVVQNDVQEDFLELKDLAPICTVSSSNGTVLFGETAGGVCMMNTSFDIDYWKAYKMSLTAMAVVGTILVTIGEDDDGINSSLKVWMLTRIEKKTPFCTRVTRLSQLIGANRVTKATAVDVHDRLQHMAVGFDDSGVLLFRGDVTKERLSQKPIVVRDGIVCAIDGPIINLSLHVLTDGRVVLFVATTRHILSYVYRDRQLEKKNLHDAKGADKQCCIMGDAALEYQFIVACRDMVYFYNPMQCADPEDATFGKCQSLDRDKDKVLIRVIGAYLCILTRDTGIIPSEQNNFMLTIYDIPGQYIAFSCSMPQVVDIFVQLNSFYVLCTNGRLWRVCEKDMNTKLDILFRKNLYDVAIGLAKRHSSGNEHITEIYKQYGDYLYKKSDYENAVKQYIHTVSTLESSYVIRKFLDPSRIEQLTNYLEALHRVDMANADHTTILLNCYTKLKATDKIEQFIAKTDHGLKCDVDTAIKVLRSANYIHEALQLAGRHSKHDIFIRILLENTYDYEAAIVHISKLPFDKIVEHIIDYGKVLIHNVPDQTMQILKMVCCTGIDGRFELPDQFMHIFVDNSKRLREFLEMIINNCNESTSNMAALHNTLLELYLREWTLINNDNDIDEFERDRRIISLLNAKCYDVEHQEQLDQALLICQMCKYTPGIVNIYEKRQMHQELLQYHLKQHNFTQAIEICQKSSNASMWTEMLWFVAKYDDDTISHNVIIDLLSIIDQHNIIPPLVVLDILSQSSSITLAIVKDYLLKWLRAENEQIEKDETLIDQYQSQIRQLEEKIDDLQYNAQIFQVNKCSACDTPLEVPTVHFLCKHSYHQHCFESYSESTNECPSCAPETKKLRNLLMAQEAGNARNTYQQFRTQLANAPNTMAMVAEFFSNGAYRSDGGGQQTSTTPTAPPKISTNPFEE